MANKQRGRKPDANSTSGKIRTLLGTGMKPGDIAKKLGCTSALVYNVRARAAGGGKRRSPGRPRKAMASGGLGGIAGILDVVKRSEHERTQLRSALERIQGVVRDALS